MSSINPSAATFLLPPFRDLHLLECFINAFDQGCAVLAPLIEHLAQAVRGDPLRQPGQSARDLAFGAVDFICDKHVLRGMEHRHSKTLQGGDGILQWLNDERLRLFPISCS